MPLSALEPVIDNRTFADIVAEARNRVPVYTPEWTDLNDNDPGMALVELFAWMTELLIYRLGQVPDLNYIKFLELVGIELQPAQSAAAEITFPVLASNPTAYILLPSLLQVSAQVPGSTAPLVFETDRSIAALKAPLAGVQAFDGYAFTDMSSENSQPGAGFQPFGPLAGAGSALYLGFQPTDPAFPQIDLDLAVVILNPPGTSSPTDCGLPQSQVYAQAQIAWEYWDGAEWDVLNLLKDDSVAFTQSGHVVLRTPPTSAGVSMQPSAVGAVAGSFYWIRARVVASSYDSPPNLYAVRTNTVSATQAQTVTGEVLGGSNASPNQTFQLANTPVLAGSLVLTVDAGDGPVTWTGVSDFFASASTDQVYTLDRTSGVIQFGDGTNGAIPVANPALPGSNVVASVYRYGGGSAANVGPNTLTTIVTPVAGLDSSNITNLLGASGGTDEETLQQAQERAPLVIQSRCRAVTASDFEVLAKQAANIARAKALPLYHPSFPDVQAPGVVTVIVVPNVPANSNPPIYMPMPSQATQQTVCSYLNQFRLLTTELYVIGPTYQQVQISGSVLAAPSADLAQVSDALEAALLAYYNPLTGGEDGSGWPFGGTVYFSLLFKLVFSVAGVQSIGQLVITLDGQAQPVCTDVPIKPDALVYSVQHSVTVSYS